MARIAGFTFLAILAVLMGFVANHFYGNWRAGEVYEQAIRGQPESFIIAKLGSPDTIEPCGKHLWWDGDMFNPPLNNGLCIKWARYNYFLSAWAFGYSADGKLVSRYHYVSE